MIYLKFFLSVQELERLKRGPPMFDLPRTWRVKKLDNSINQDTQDLPPQPAGSDYIYIFLKVLIKTIFLNN